MAAAPADAVRAEQSYGQGLELRCCSSCGLMSYTAACLQFLLMLFVLSIYVGTDTGRGHNWALILTNTLGLLLNCAWVAAAYWAVRQVRHERDTHVQRETQRGRERDTHMQRDVQRERERTLRVAA